MTHIGCRNIWRAVIKQAVEDFKRKQLSANYFTSEDFKIVCELAETTISTFPYDCGMNSPW